MSEAGIPAERGPLRRGGRGSWSEARASGSSGASRRPPKNSEPRKQYAVPQAWSEKVEAAGLAGVRYVVRSDTPEVVREALEIFQRERAYLAEQGQGNGLLPDQLFASIMIQIKLIATSTQY